MQGTMLWFNLDKGYGFIHTEADERLYVARTGFQPGHEPKPRCKGQAVTFDRHVASGDARAINVEFTQPPSQRRARTRRGRGGHAF
jgi:cold shock CspA family protein